MGYPTAFARLFLSVCLSACGIIEPPTTFDIPRAVTKPIAAASGHRFVSLSSGFFHSCAIDAEGRAWCWGDNQYRQSGLDGPGEPCDQTSTCALKPVLVSPNIRFASISAGTTNTCGLDINGTAYCWGGGYYENRGILGDGSLTRSASPVAVATTLKFKTISAGGQIICALAQDDRGYCWGGGGYLGNGGLSNSLVPAPIAGDIRFSALAAGGSHGCGLSLAGEAYCWGNNWYGQVGDGVAHADLSQVTLVRSPLRVKTQQLFKSISAGGSHTCAVTLAEAVMCWGSNNVGQIGSGTFEANIPTPSYVIGPNHWRSVAASMVHTCGITVGGATMCWGGNWFGALGDGGSTAIGNGTEHGVPTPMVGGHTFSAVKPGGSHTCALDESGLVWCWGDRGRGQMGDGKNTRIL